MIYYHFNIPTVGPFRCADTHIVFNMLLCDRIAHSKKYHKYITNIPQIYHKSTTKCDIVLQKCDIAPQKCDIVPQNRVFYYKM